MLRKKKGSDKSGGGEMKENEAAAAIQVFKKNHLIIHIFTMLWFIIEVWNIISLNSSLISLANETIHKIEFLCTLTSNTPFWFKQDG